MRVVVSQFEGIDATPVLPLAAGCLVATARLDAELARAARFSIAIERLAIPKAVESLDRPSLLGLSLYPWNVTYSLAVAAAARQAFPDCLIVAGGPSVPRRPERARRFFDEQPAIDVLFFAEGELAFRDLARAHLHRTGFGDIPGVALRGNSSRTNYCSGQADPRGIEGDHCFTTPPGRIHDFAVTGSPFLDGTFDELFDRHGSQFTMALCETNRGCPFSCTFCDWSLTKHVIEFPIERVQAELEWVVRHGFRHVMLADANFGIRPRDTDIARYLADLRKSRGSPTSFYFYLTKNNHRRNLETLEILQEAGIGCWVSLSVQDFDDRVLEAVKRDNIQTGESLKLRTICAERGIPTFNELILGLPGQTYDSFTDTVAQAMPGLPRHTFVLFLCRLIDNTELGDPASRERFALETRRCLWKTSTPNWDPIVDEYQEVVVATRDLPLADWERTYRFAFFAAALYNLRLLRVVLHYVVDGAGANLRSYLAHLVASMVNAERGSLYADLNAIFDRYIGSVLGGGPFVLPMDDSDGAAPVYLDEAVAYAVLSRYDEFLSESETVTREYLSESQGFTREFVSESKKLPCEFLSESEGLAREFRSKLRLHTEEAPVMGGGDTLAGAFRYQSLITPRWGVAEQAVAELGHDWPGFVDKGIGATLTARETSARFVPPGYVAATTFATFAAAHLGSIRANLDIGRVEPHASSLLVLR